VAKHYYRRWQQTHLKRTDCLLATSEFPKVEVMRRAIRAKFRQHAELAAALLATGTAELVEDSSSDRFWGSGADGKGINWLGRLLVEVRGELVDSRI
jgi:ribA/ribD-fused uncharacterized protein